MKGLTQSGKKKLALTCKERTKGLSRRGRGINLSAGLVGRHLLEVTQGGMEISSQSTAVKVAQYEGGRKFKGGKYLDLSKLQEKKFFSH